MTILSIIASVLSLAKWLVSWAERQGWIEEGRKQILLESLQRADHEIESAQAARAAVRTDIANNPDGLRNDDGYKRPGD